MSHRPDPSRRHHHHDRHVHRLGHVLLPGPRSPGRPVHRLDRRRFLTELGRSTFAVTILGGWVAACSGDDDAAPGPTERADDAPATTGAPATTAAPAAEPTAAPTDEVAEEPAAAGEALSWAPVDLGFVSAYVLVRGNTAAIVDTGTAASADEIGETLATLGVTYDDVAHVVLTHHHPDHIGSLPDVLDLSASASPMVYAGAADIANIASPVAITAVGDGDDVFGLQVIETPGHTPGSISVLDPGIGLLLAGDALNGNDDGTGISGPNAQFTDDMTVATESVAKLAGFDFSAAGFGHGEPVLDGADALVRALASG